MGSAGDDDADPMSAAKTISCWPKLDVHPARTLAISHRIGTQSGIAIADIGGARVWRHIAQAQVEIRMRGIGAQKYFAGNGADHVQIRAQRWGAEDQYVRSTLQFGHVA